jgi:6-phosphogluconolactonase/glucosamine-6-phosphate isomerase/deaminase
MYSHFLRIFISPDDLFFVIGIYGVKVPFFFNPSPKQPFIMGLLTGSSLLGIYKELIGLYQEGKIPFANVVTFNIDEFVGLNENHPQSYHRFMWDNFFQFIDIEEHKYPRRHGQGS